MMIGLSELRRRSLIDAAMIQAFRGLPVVNVSDVMSRMSAGGLGL
jgi:hypothetical protein